MAAAPVVAVKLAMTCTSSTMMSMPDAAADACDALHLRRPRVLIAPVPVTPTKPLTPSHVKLHMWVDVLFKATKHLCSVEYLYAHAAANACQQTLGFWEYLDRVVGDVDYDLCDEHAIGEHYARYHAEPGRVSRGALLPYLSAYERSAWIHPSSRRILDIWQQHFQLLGLHDPGLRCAVAAPLSAEEVIGTLCDHGLCLNARIDGGGIYLDATAHGLPLRLLVDENGVPNYLMLLLRDLIPRMKNYDEIVLVHDHEITSDYVMLQKVLEGLGGTVCRIGISRVAVNGHVRSSRFGDWKGHTVPDLARTIDFSMDSDPFRLGLRIFYISVIGLGERKSFDTRLLQRCIRRAEAILSSAAGEPSDFPTWLSSYVNRNMRHVDPYRLTTSLLEKGRNAPVKLLAEEVFK